MTTRVFVLGLDGMSPALWQRLSGLDALPYLGRLFRHTTTLRSTVPAHTAPAWTSIATGLDPGAHGVLGFWHRPTGLPWPFSKRPLVTRARAPFLWEVASQHGIGVGVFNYPLSYPPTPVKGYWVCGLNAPQRARDAIYPASAALLLDDFKTDADEVGINLFGSRPLTNRQRQRALRALTELLQNHLTCGRRLIAQGVAEGVHLFVHVLTVTDRFLHLFWDVLHAPNHPLFEPAMAFWQALDAGVSAWLEAAQPDVVFLVSDHGFADSPRFALNLDLWLTQAGLLPRAARLSLPVALKVALKSLLPECVQRVWRHRASSVLRHSTAAHAMFSIEVLYGPWVGVTFSPGLGARERTRLSERLSQAAEALLTEQGTRVFRAVQPAAEVWQGSRLPHLPDWVLTLSEGFGGAVGSLDPRLFIPVRSVRTGDHHPDGVLAAAQPLPERTCWHVRDVAELVCNTLGLPRIESSEPDGPALLAEHDAQALTQRLRRLGYLE
ncbi:MAG: alkaline phosphatase family protein [Thermoflexales bacterium]|nr:alkaline phosphatase family protein [Thermoflexales bacterium]